MFRKKTYRLSKIDIVSSLTVSEWDSTQWQRVRENEKYKHDTTEFATEKKKKEIDLAK
tara:strand:+ start:1672 stop:1845 length:174 start_codon:yes stop_codon:yes gene_type:complete